MNTTLNFEIAPEPKKNGTYPIYLRATQNGIHHKMVLSVFVTKKSHFTPQAKKEAWINPKEPLAKVFNRKLAEIQSNAYTLMATMERKGTLAAQELIQQLKGGRSSSLIAYAEEQQKQSRTKGQYSKALIIEQLILKIKGFSPRREPSFREITPHWIAQFVAYLEAYQKVDGKPLSPVTIQTYVARLRTLYKSAVGDGLAEEYPNPFARIVLKKSDTRKAGLSKEELTKLEELPLTEYSTLWHVRNYFLFAVYAAGMRISDVMLLGWTNIQNDRLVYRMKKTGKECSIPLCPQAQKIIDQYRTEASSVGGYVFPILRRTKGSELFGYMRDRCTNINYHLSKLQKMADIQTHISSHIARHTFAHLATQSGGNIVYISHLLGHSSIGITQVYLKGLDNRYSDDLLKQVFAR